VHAQTPPNDPVGAAAVTFGAVAFADATATFVLFGATSSVFGPLLISFSHRFHLSLPAAGTVLSVFFIGALLGVPIGWLVVKQFRASVVLSATMVLMAVGSAGAAFSSQWTAFLISIFVIGLAFGGADFALNTLLVRTEPVHRGHRLSLANAGYGVGAVVGPVLIIIVRPHNFEFLFGAFAVVAIVLSTLTGGIVAPPLRLSAHHELAQLSSRRRKILPTFIAAYILYVATETSTSGWIAPQLHRTGYTQALASIVTAGFWAGLAVGRVVGGPLAKRSSEKVLVLGGLVASIVLCLCAFSTVLSPYAYPLLGLAIASVYPMGLIWYTMLCPHDGNGLALLIFFMMAGGVIGPATVSFMVSVAGIHCVPLVIATFAALDLAVFASALRFRPVEHVGAPLIL